MATSDIGSRTLPHRRLLTESNTHSLLSLTSHPPITLLLDILLNMSAYPAYAMGGLCIIGGLTGFARTRSIPSLVAGVGVGLIYLWSADSIRKGTANGLEGALGASALLFLSSMPRAAKGPIPAILAVTSAGTGFYYGQTVYNLRA